MFKKIALLSGVLVLSGFTVYNVFSNVKKVSAVAPCIITISGVQYDVGPLTVPGAHSGGNVFVCGTDMTALFMSVPSHAADIARMAPYIYVAPTPTATPTTVPTVSPTVTPTATPSPTVTPTETPVPSVSPTATPSPSVSPTPHKDDDDDDENEVENENEVGEHNDKDHKKEETRERGKSQEHASAQGIASRNEHSQHKDD